MPYLFEQKEEQIFETAIYVILSPFDKSCFVGKTGSSNLKTVYKKHYYCQVPKTKDLFLKSKKEGKKPPMCLLEQIKTTNSKAFHHQIAWTKLFVEHGYQSLSGKGIDQYVNDLKEETKIIYEEIREIPLSSICNPDNDLFPKFGMERVRQPKDDKNQIHINFKLEEYELIKKKAENHNMTITAYARSMILNEKIIDIDVFKILVEFIKCFNERNKLLKEILTAFYVSGKYHPMDLKIIQDAIKETREQKIQVIKDVSEILNQLKNESDN